MTQKDYVKIAAALTAERDNMEATSYRRSDDAHHWFTAGWEVTVRKLADTLAADNSRFDRDRFDRDRFYRAAGLH